ncbi:MAG TPA: YbfB/YjiJ family MFS transporter [Pseudonocardiaceae bacterium]|jgi:predicted MFS family arabinose efflux permease
MAAVVGTPSRPAVGSWWLVARAAAALAAGMGLGRFVYTPILPLMHAQAGLSPALGADLATVNYVGYLVGALAAIVVPRLAVSRTALRVSLVAVAASLALMPVSETGAVWLVLRLVAGVASAVVFVVAASSLLHGLRGRDHHLVGWGFGGVGAGIALSGVLVLVLRDSATWQQAWWSAAGLAALCAIAAWSLPTPSASDGHVAGKTKNRGKFAILVTSYSLEGVGYIVAGTFLVAAIDQTASGGVGDAAWVLVGLAAVPSAALWAWWSRRWSRPALLVVALAVQAVGVALPAVVGGAGAALLSAVLFGATFLGVATLSLAVGAHLGVPKAVAILTTGYSIGQIVGPLAVEPLLHSGYHQPLVLSAVIVAIAAVAAGVLRMRSPL